MVLVLIQVVADAVVDGIPDTEDLKIYLHDQRPLRVVGLGQHRPRDVRGWPLNDPLDDSRAGAATVGATTATWRRVRRLDLVVVVIGLRLQRR
jgi:hypothetical protein